MTSLAKSMPALPESTASCEIRGELGTLNRTIIQVGGGLIGTVLIAAAGLIATQL
jgi:hypothetical protein